MNKLLATICKEILILLRDKAGLAVLFLMPMLLVFVVTLVQDAPIRKFQQSRLFLLFVDNDREVLGRAIEEGLRKSEYFEVIKKIDDKEATDETVRQAIARGKFKVGIIIPEGATQRVEQKARNLFYEKFARTSSPKPDSSQDGDLSADIIIYFDPTIQQLFKSSVKNALAKFAEKIKSVILFNIVTRELTEKFENSIGIKAIIPQDLPLAEGEFELVSFKEEYPYEQKSQIMPNAVQHNVPAWTMFAMFFIAIPLGGSMIKERNQGNLARLMTMPISYSTLLIGKISVYLIVCMIQMTLMLMVGIFILPALGTPALSLGSSPTALLVVVICAALGATGFGVLVGTIATSHEQASTFSAIAIIIAAALGGVMMPVYLMPHIMQKISVFSPLAWGLDAFLDIFIRNGTIMTVFPYALRLFVFFLVTLSLSVLFFRFKKNI